MKYADVILPLPLNGLFTYSIPTHLANKVRFGIRVRVPLGRSKTYTAIVVTTHDNQPTNYVVKDIIEVYDSLPILLEKQYTLWQWISSYYMSPIGDVYKAAMPSGLKTEDHYKPKTETYIRLTANYQSEQSLHIAMNMLARAPKQLQVLTDYLALSHEDGSLSLQNSFTPSMPISRDTLMNHSHATVAVITMLIKRGILETYEVEIGRLNHAEKPHPERIKLLNTYQQEAYNQIVFSFIKKDITLLHGVTSSGKTEIYIHLIQQAIDKHLQVLYLLPEIALTVQITTRLQGVFGNRLGIYHSKYSDAERVEIWQKQLSDNPYEIILGARSSIFLPFQRLGLVIVDEEHETSYKQQDPSPRYHARSAALILARMYGAKTLLGTATPCAETYTNAVNGKYGLVKLERRHKDIELPEIEVVDIQDLQHRKMMTGPFSPRLLEKINEALTTDHQVILFQNRRGFAPVITCKACGWVPRCTNCDVSLTYHRNLNQLTCHYCGYTYKVPVKCPNCGSTELLSKGYGTEKIEDYIRELFPHASVARMDLDTTRTRNAYEHIINDFSQGKTNILIGTQMISKGLDFARVSTVGILNADSILNYPDFRAYEHAYMMMSQVAGRAGRSGNRGIVILQTKNPDVPIIRQVVDHDYPALYSDILAEREMFRYPPFYRLIYVYLKHRNDALVESAAIEFSSRLREQLSVRILGPDKPAVAKVKALNIRKIVVKLETALNIKKVREFLLFAQQQMLEDPRYTSLQIYYDVDPL